MARRRQSARGGLGYRLELLVRRLLLRLADLRLRLAPELFRLRLAPELFRLRLAPELFRLRLAPELFRLRLALLRPVLLRLRVAPELFRLPLADFRRRVAAPLRAAAEREDFEREAEALPPFFPPRRDEVLVVFLPRPDPLFFPPPVSLFTVAQARRSASRSETPRFS
jgi:hypothetical protein